MNKGRQVLLISSSQLYGFEYLQHAKEELVGFLTKNAVKQVLFVPYAQFDYDKYTEKVAKAFKTFGVDMVGIHTFDNVHRAVEEANCIFIGGGNSFKLLKQLYESALIEPIRKRVLIDAKLAYIGSSAGTNVATMSINTTNDMPIVYPPSFKALGLVPFNINPHFIDTLADSKHQGETRETRINEFHQLNDTLVLALREGTSLLVDGNSAKLVGKPNARLFQAAKEAVEIPANSDVSHLFTE